MDGLVWDKDMDVQTYIHLSNLSDDDFFESRKDKCASN